MPLQLDHTIVPAYDKVKSAEFIARRFGLKYEGPGGHFAPVKVNDILTLDFDDSETLAPTTTPSWPWTGSSTRSCSGSRTRRSSSGAGRSRGRTGGAQPPALGAWVLLRVRERACLGGYYAHVCYGLREYGRARRCWQGVGVAGMIEVVWPLRGPRLDRPASMSPILCATILFGTRAKKDRSGVVKIKQLWLLPRRVNGYFQQCE